MGSVFLSWKDLSFIELRVSMVEQPDQIAVGQIDGKPVYMDCHTINRVRVSPLKWLKGLIVF